MTLARRFRLWQISPMKVVNWGVYSATLASMLAGLGALMTGHPSWTYGLIGGALLSLANYELWKRLVRRLIQKGQTKRPLSVFVLKVVLNGLVVFVCIRWLKADAIAFVSAVGAAALGLGVAGIADGREDSLE